MNLAEKLPTVGGKDYGAEAEGQQTTEWRSSQTQLDKEQEWLIRKSVCNY